MRATNVSLALVAIASAGICGAGCSSDDSGNPTQPSVDAAMETKVTRDATPVTPQGDTGGGAGPLMCTNSTGTCAATALAGGMVNLAACCSTANKKCGNDISSLAGAAGMIPGGAGGPAPMLPSDTCIERDQPGSDDPTCPDQAIFGLTFKGCCTAKNKCGNRSDTLMVPMLGAITLGFGCADPAAIGMAPDGGAQSCTYIPDGGTPDGGTPETGNPEAGPPEAGPDGGADAPADGGNGDAAEETATSDAGETG